MDAAQTGDFSTALREWKPLAEQGHVNAQHNLGVMYYKGKSAIHDNVYAHMWWSIAASQGQKIASKYLRVVTKEMTPSQIEKAQDFARECVKKNYKGC